MSNTDEEFTVEYDAVSEVSDAIRYAMGDTGGTLDTDTLQRRRDMLTTPGTTVVATAEESEDIVRMFISNVLLFYARSPAIEPVLQGLVNMYRTQQGDRAAKRTYIRGIIGAANYPNNVVCEGPTEEPPAQEEESVEDTLGDRLVAQVRETERQRLADEKEELNGQVSKLQRTMHQLRNDLENVQGRLCTTLERRHLLRTKTPTLVDAAESELRSLADYLRNSSLYDYANVELVESWLRIPTRDVVLRDYRPDQQINRQVNLGSMWVGVDIKRFRVKIFPRTKNLITNKLEDVSYNGSNPYDTVLTPGLENGRVMLHPHVSGNELCMGALGQVYNRQYGKPVASMEAGSLLRIIRGVEGILSTYNHESPYTSFVAFEAHAVYREAVKQCWGKDVSLIQCLPKEIQVPYHILVAQNMLGDYANSKGRFGTLRPYDLEYNTVGNIRYYPSDMPEWLTNSRVCAIGAYACDYVRVVGPEDMLAAAAIIRDQYNNITSAARKIKAKNIINHYFPEVTSEQA